jgi:monofunctional biosynthetic peptidoglycan transglycosylase
MIRRILVALPFAAIGALVFWWLVLPWPMVVLVHDPARTSFMELRVRQASGAGREYRIRHSPVPIERISRNLQRAVIVAEDGRFMDHRGIDWEALGEELGYDADADFSLLDPRDLGQVLGAIGFYIRHRDDVRGRSTITQQLAKNLYFSADRSVLRKFEELIVARRLELFLSKQRILELYLNVAEWGPGIFGAEAAAQYYYGRSAAQLSRDQAASLAATLPHPLTSNPRTRPARMNWRKQLILRRM